MFVFHCHLVALFCFAFLSPLVKPNQVTLRCSASGLSGIPGLESETAGWSYEQKNAVNTLQSRIREIQGQLNRPLSIQQTQVPISHSPPSSRYSPSSARTSAQAFSHPNPSSSGRQHVYPSTRQSAPSHSNAPFLSRRSPSINPFYSSKNSRIQPTPLRGLSHFSSSKNSRPTSLSFDKLAPSSTSSKSRSPLTKPRFLHNTLNSDSYSSFSPLQQSHFPSSVSREKSVFSARYPGFKRFSSSAPPKSSTFVPKKTSRFFPSSAAENSHIATSFSSAKSGSSSLHQQSSFSQPNSRNTDAVSSSPSNRIIHPISTSTQSHLFLSSHPLAPKETFLDSVAGKSPNSPIFSSRKDRSPPAFEPSISLDSFHRTSHFSPLSAANFISPYNKLPAPSNVNRWHHVYSEHFDGPTFHDLPTLDPSKISSTKHKIEAKYLDNYRPHKVLRNLYEIESTPHNENHIITSERWLSSLENSSVPLGTRDTGSLWNCNQLFANGYDADGHFEIEIYGQKIRIHCQFQQDGHNWMVIQRRRDGSEDFYRNWSDYERGFGNPDNEFWMGLSSIHAITRNQIHELVIELEDFDGEKVFAKYSVFFVGNPESNYPINVYGYSGTAGDSLSYHNQHPFSTKDRDHDSNYRANCAVNNHGGWWYNSCQHSNLNGEYFQGGVQSSRGLGWYYWKHNHYSMKKSTMKIRPM